MAVTDDEDAFGIGYLSGDRVEEHGVVTVGVVHVVCLAGAHVSMISVCVASRHALWFDVLALLGQAVPDERLVFSHDDDVECMGE